MQTFKTFILSGAFLTIFSFVSYAQEAKSADAIIAKAVQNLGGSSYLNVTSVISEGSLSMLQNGVNSSYQTFTDVIVFPDRERTDFSEGGSRTIQVNTGEKGWIFEEKFESFRDQDEKGIAAFNIGLRSHYDFLLRGKFRQVAQLSYVGKRAAEVGRRNEVLKLTFADGFEVEYEFSFNGMPAKTIYRTKLSDDSYKTEETRYNRFVNYQGIQTPTIVDRYSDDKYIYRISFEKITYNKKVDDAIFTKPESIKKIKKLKL
ncbi:MAG: hypothetical protein ACK5NT_13145 [Pyrinomonadaceae bacterium]